VRGFKTLKTAYATIAGFEVMSALRKGQAASFNLTRDIRGEARIVERAFGLGPSTLTETIALIKKRLISSPLEAGATKRLRIALSKPEACNSACSTEIP
jgi:IS6 family transposase